MKMPKSSVKKKNLHSTQLHKAQTSQPCTPVTPFRNDLFKITVWYMLIFWSFFYIILHIYLIYVSIG